MENEGQQVLSQLSSQKHTIKPLLVIAIAVLFLILLSGIIGYLIGVKTGENAKSQVALQPIPTSPIANVTQRPTPKVISALPTSIPTTVTTMTFPPMPTVDVAHWKTYTNTTYGYSIQYPPDYTVLPGWGGDPAVSVLLNFENMQQEFVTNINILEDPPITTTLYRWVQEHGGLVTNTNTDAVIETKYTPMSFTNHYALLVEQEVNRNNQLINLYIAFIEKDLHTIIVVGSGMPFPVEDTKDKAIFLKMLSTFRFTTP